MHCDMALPTPLGGSRPSNKNILLKIVILGDGGVGKSCLMNRYVNNFYDGHSLHTIGVEFLNKDIEINGEMYTMQVWDTAGQERFKSLRTPFYRGSDICMLTFAVDDRTSFRNLAMWRNEFLYYADIKDGAVFPFIVIANKVDLDPNKREVTETEILSWCNENGQIPYIETSAKDAVNVDTAFSIAVENWMHMEESLERVDRFSDNTINLSHRNQNRKRPSCCSGTD